MSAHTTGASDSGGPATLRPLRVGVVGARQAVQGIGAYVAREFARAGCDVVGIVGTSAATVAEARVDLERRFGLSCEGYTQLAELLARQRPDIVALCSPAGGHREQLAEALAAGVHVFCEKPLWWDDSCRSSAGGDALASVVAGMAQGFADRGLLLELNTQWPCTLESYRRLHPDVLRGEAPWPVSRFDMLLSPIRRGPDLVVDGAPHALSLLAALTGHGRVEAVSARWPGPDDTALDLAFRYVHARGETAVSLRLRTCPQQPRPAGYGVDGAWAERQVTQPGYRMSLSAAGRSEPLHDPLDLRVARFVADVRARKATDVQGLVESLVNLRDLVAAAEDRDRPRPGPAADPASEVPA